MQLFIVVRTGDFTEEMNGTPITAQRTAVLGVYESEDEAKRAMETFTGSDGWGLSFTSVEPAALNAPPTDQ